MSSNTGNTINIAITGVGGQGVLTLAELLAKTVLAEGMNVRVGEIHGMAQRGGHVVCTVRIGDNASGPVIDAGSADLLVGFEPAETLREIHLVKKGGFVLMSTHIQYPVAVSMGKAEYPDHSEIVESIRKFTDKILEIDAQKIAIEAGSSRALNMVMFGGIIGVNIIPIDKETALKAISEAFPKKFQKINTTAAENGLEYVKSLL